MSAPPALIEAPVPPASPAARPRPGARSGSGRRPVFRWAVRLFRREWRQQLLVLGLLTLAVAAAVTGSIAVINGASDATGRHGSGGALVRLDAADATTVEQTIAAVRSQFGIIDVVAHTTVAVPGSVRRLDVRDQDPDGAYSTPMLDLRDGLYPVAAGEVGLTAGAAREFGVSVGERVDVGLRAGLATVVGIVENPSQLDDDFVLVAPGTLPNPSTYNVLVDLDTRTTPSGGGGPGFGLEVEGSDKAAVAAGVISMSTLAMALVALIASAGFVVIAQRRQRQLGLLAAIGGTGRHVRLVTVANGLLVGLAAAVIGGALGIAGWIVAAPAVESAANHRIRRFDLPWTIVSATLLIAVVMATLAAWWPARVASRLPVMAALSGRPAPPHPVHRSVLGAILFVGGGVAAVAVADPGGSQTNALLLIAGLLAVVVGAVFAAPAAIRVAGSVARRLPFAPRLALRDLARYQSRAAASLAAIAFGLGISASIVAVAAANEYSGAEGNLSSRELLIRFADSPRLGPDSGLTATQDGAALDASAADVAAAIGAGTTAVALDVAYNPDTSGDTRVREPVGLVLPHDEHMMELLSYPYVATSEVLALYDIDPAAIGATTDLLTSHDAPVTLIDMTKRPDASAAPVVQRVDLPKYDDAPNSLITEGAVERNGWVRQRAAWIVEAAEPLTAAQIDAARDAAAAAGLAIETRDAQDGLATLRTAGTAAGLLLALAIVAMAVGLIRGESARDIRTLTATGASARTRRALTATTAAALALLGAVLGIGIAYLVLIASYRSDLGELTPVPIGDLAVLVLGVPLAATAVGWLLAGKEPTAFSRQSLD